MKYLSFLIKPASSSCNMRCRYCFYYDVVNNREIKNYGIMEEETYKNLINKSLQYKNEKTFVTYSFQGGEPTVAGLTFFKNFCNYVDEIKSNNHEVKYAIQTNGLMLDEEWIAFFKERNFLVGVSIDGYKDNHDYLRKDSHSIGTFDRIMKNVALLKKEQVDFNILCVLTKTLAKHPSKLYNFFKKNEFEYVQLIPCLPELNKKEEDSYALTPKLFASFYKQFYSLWEKDLRLGRVMSVSLFDNVLPMFKGIPPNQCGMLGFCSCQYVLEANGDVYPCDFYVLDEYKFGNINIDDIEELNKSLIVKEFLSEEKRMSSCCDECKFFNLCQGNCKRMNHVYFDDDGYCGYQDFLNTHYQSMVNIVKDMMR